MSVNGVDDLPATSTFLRTHPGEAGALLQGPADQRHQLLSRPRGLRCARRRRSPRCSQARRRATRCASGCAACATGEEAYSIAMLLRRACRARSTRRRHLQVFATDLDEDAIRTGARGRLSGDDRGRRLRGAAAPLLRARAARLPGARRAARDGPVRHPRPAEGRAVLAPRPGHLPQPAHLPEPRSAAARARDLPLRAAPDGAALPRRLGDGRRRRAPVSAPIDKKHRIYEPRASRERRCRAVVPAAPACDRSNSRSPPRAAGAPATLPRAP